MAVDIQDFLRKIEQDSAIRQGLVTLLEAVVPEKQRVHESSEDILEWIDEDTLAEQVNAEMIRHSPASRTHQDLAGFGIDLKNLYRVSCLRNRLFCSISNEITTFRTQTGLVVCKP